MTIFVSPQTLLRFKVRVGVRVRVRAGVSANTFSIKRVFEQVYIVDPFVALFLLFGHCYNVNIVIRVLNNTVDNKNNVTVVV